MSWIDAYIRKLDSGGTATAIVESSGSVSYRDFAAKVSERARLFHNQIGPGSVVALESDFCIDAAVSLLALIASRNIVVLASSSIGIERCLRAVPVDHLISSLQGLDAPVTCKRSPMPSSHILNRLRDDGRAGVVLLTSGSTGIPKACAYDAENLVQGESAGQTMRTLPLLLLDHIGGVNTLFTIFRRKSVLVCPSSRQPAAVVKDIEQHQVEAIVTSPSFLNLLLLSGSLDPIRMRSLRTINYSGEPMPEPTLRSLRETIPHVKCSQAFGSTETGILPFKSASSDTTFLIPKENCQVRVRDGMLEVKSSRGMLGYLYDQAPITDDGYFRTGDAVIQEGTAYRILGRSADIICVGSEKFYPQEVEDLLRQMHGVIDVAVRGIPNPITGQIVSARFWLVRSESLGDLRRRVYTHCKGRLPHHQIPRHLEISLEPILNTRMKRVRT